MYCTTDEVKNQLKDDVITSVIGADRLLEREEKDRLIEPILSDAIADASGEVDGYLNKRYAVPLIEPPSMIAKLTKDIAVYNVMSRSGMTTSEKENNYLTRYNAAIKYLTMAAEGKVDIGIKVASGAPTTQSTFHFNSASPIFGRDKMRGM